MKRVVTLGILAIVAVGAISALDADLFADKANVSAALALRQFESGQNVADQLNRHEAARQWWNLAVPAGLVLLACVWLGDETFFRRPRKSKHRLTAIANQASFPTNASTNP